MFGVLELRINCKTFFNLGNPFHSPAMLPYVTALFMLLSCTCGENPAIQVLLTNKGLQEATHAAKEWALEMLPTIPIPDFSGEVSVLIGNIDYTLSDITITRCDFPDPSVAFVQDHTGIQASVSGLNVALTGNWEADAGIFDYEGSFDMVLLGVNVQSVVELGRDPGGHLSVSGIRCYADVGDVNIELDSWLIQKFVEFLEDQIKEKIEDNICPMLEKSIVRLDYYLQAIDVSVNINQVLAVDLPLIVGPVMDATSVNLGLKGEFYSIQTHKDPPFEAQPFTLTPQPDYMLSAGFSEYTLNSASYGYFSAGLLQLLITDSMIPPGSPVRLNTTAMGRFIPQLPKMFPDLLMTLQVNALEAPVVSLKPDVAKLTVQVAVKAFAIAPNQTQIPLFKLRVDFKSSSKVWISDGRVKASMMMDNLTLTLVASEIGTFTTDPMENMMKVGMKIIVLPKLNAKLSKGVPLPGMKQAQLVNSMLKIEEGFIAISSDAEMEPREGN